MKKTRMTNQKRIIDEEIHKLENFFSADKLHSHVKEIDPKIGIATVYRYLKERSSEDLHMYNCNGRTIYSSNKNNHCHFQCSRCGKLYHLDVKNIDFFKHGIQGDISHFQLDVYGICENCIGNDHR